MLQRFALVVTAVLALACAACESGSDGDSTESVNETFSEGEMSIEIETLDTGLLKGHAFADASEGWTVAAFSVRATDQNDVAWQVIEPEITGVGGPNVSEFFEVVIQELPRGERITVEAIATFRDNGGAEVERRVVDNWPP